MNREKEEPSTMAVADGSAGRNSLEVNISPQRKKSMTEEEKREKRNERARRWRQKNPEKVKAILRRRLANPHMTMKQIQKDLQLRSDKRVYDFFHRKCEKFPMMSEISYIAGRKGQEGQGT